MPSASFIRVLALVVGVAAFTPARGGAADRTAPHPDAPPETAQFGFLIGAWDCVIRTMGPTGELGPGRPATWRGRYILDGWAIEDLWISTGPDGSESQGMNIRSFNPETRVWDNRWLAQGSLQWKYYSAEKVGDTMVMTGGEGVDPRGAFIDRNTFHDIGADSWRWRKDRSWDGGETWIEGIATISAERSAGPDRD